MLAPSMKMETVRWKRKVVGHFYHSPQGYVFMTPEARRTMGFTPMAIRATIRAAFNALSKEPDEQMRVSTSKNVARLKQMGKGQESHVYKLHMKRSVAKGKPQQQTIALKFFKINPEWDAPFKHKGIAQVGALMHAKEEHIEGPGFEVRIKPLTPLFVVSNGADHHIVAYKEVINATNLQEFMDLHPHVQSNARLYGRMVLASRAARDRLIAQGFVEVKDHNLLVEDYDIDDPKRVRLTLRVMDVYHPTSEIANHLHNKVSDLFPGTPIR